MPKVTVRDSIVELYPDEIYVMEVRKSDIGNNKDNGNNF